jgi:hypothetical protein
MVRMARRVKAGRCVARISTAASQPGNGSSDDIECRPTAVMPSSAVNKLMNTMFLPPPPSSSRTWMAASAVPPVRGQHALQEQDSTSPVSLAVEDLRMEGVVVQAGSYRQSRRGKNLPGQCHQAVGEW